MTAPALPSAPAPERAGAPVPNSPDFRRATFKDATTPGAAAFAVHFNPVTLQITLANTLEEKGKDKRQYVSKSSAKLTMDLVFDTTDTGADVRSHTGRVAKFMDPVPGQGGRTPPTVLFEWGTFKFQGLVESYKETLDFFSHDGVPLRAAVNLTLARQELVFSADAPPPSSGNAVDVPSGGDVSQIASQGGNPGAGRALAAANGLESMRFFDGALTVDASVTLGGPAGLSGGLSAGLSGGLSLGASAGAGLSLGGGPAFGASASAGVTASAGAFAGLRVGASARGAAAGGPPLDPARLLPQVSAGGAVAAGPRAAFGIGGRATVEGSASLGTNVGATAQARVRFDGR